MNIAEMVPTNSFWLFPRESFQYKRALDGVLATTGAQRWTVKGGLQTRGDEDVDYHFTDTIRKQIQMHIVRSNSIWEEAWNEAGT